MNPAKFTLHLRGETFHFVMNGAAQSNIRKDSARTIHNTLTSLFSLTQDEQKTLTDNLAGFINHAP